MPLRVSGYSRPSRVWCAGIRRKIPWWAPRKLKVMSSRTIRLPSPLTTMLVTKLSIANSPRVWAATPGTTTSARAAPRASAKASAAGRRMQSAPESDARDLTIFGAFELEVLPLGEPEELRDLVRRKAVDRGVEVAHDRVVVAARALDRLLELRERALEVSKALVSLQIGVRLGEREQLSQGAGQLVLGLRARLGGLRRHGRAAGAHHLVERAALVRRVAPHRLDQVGHQVGAALELHVDVRPRFLGSLAQAHELVVRHHDGHDEAHEDEQEHNAAERHELPPRSS